MRHVPRLTLRYQLTLLYGGFFLAAGFAVLAVPIFSIHSSAAAMATPHDIALMEASQQRQAVRAVLVLVALVAVSLVVGWLIAGRFLRPLRTITATARHISASNLHRRLEPGARDNEFAELGATLNSLFGRLEGAFESQRRFVANASHELRTPLSAARALLQVALADPGASPATLRATCQEVLSLGEQQEQLIAALLTLATSQRGLDRAEPLDLAAITRDVLQARQPEARRRDIKVSAALTPAPASGDPNLAESLVANLVDNAIRHNVPGGEVEVVTGPATPAGPAGAAARIAVRNTGPVVPPTEVDRLFEPFHQLGAERTGHGDGHGLGLAIVHAIAAAHGAVLTAHARPLGGLDIEVCFAAAADPSAAARQGETPRRQAVQAAPG
ncbi:MAG TPA: HAMP domain-containing sensor histidine kinase [Streptosporangiaceae bacterium]|jgi:signal transduction histidine kinase